MSGMTRRDVSTAQLMKTHGYSARTDYHKDKQDAQAVRELASEILRLTRSTLLINMRFLESALVRFVPGDETVTPEMATDGRFLYYNSIHICRLFKTSPQLVCRDYLHLTLHCIFRHLFVGEKLNGELWDLACDIAVEHLITGLGINRFTPSGRKSSHGLPISSRSKCRALRRSEYTAILSSRICRRRRSDAYGNISMPTITAYGTNSPKQAPAENEARAGIRRRTAPTAHPSLAT